MELLSKIDKRWQSLNCIHLFLNILREYYRVEQFQIKFKINRNVKNAEFEVAIKEISEIESDPYSFIF